MHNLQELSSSETETADTLRNGTKYGTKYSELWYLKEWH